MVPPRRSMSRWRSTSSCNDFVAAAVAFQTICPAVRLRIPRVLALICVAGAALRFATLDVQSLWFDEAVTAHLLRLGLAGLRHAIPDSESTPPLYYVLGWLWTQLADRRGRDAVAVGAARQGDDPRRVGARTAARRRPRGPRRRRVAGRQPDARVVQPGGPSLRAARAARCARRAVLAARRSSGRGAGRARGVVGRRRARGRDALLRDLPGRAAGAMAAAARPRRARARRRARAAGLALAALAPLALGQRANDTATFIADLEPRTRLAQVPKQLLVGYDAPAETLLAVLSAVVLSVALSGSGGLPAVAPGRGEQRGRGGHRDGAQDATAGTAVAGGREARMPAARMRRTRGRHRERGRRGRSSGAHRHAPADGRRGRRLALPALAALAGEDHLITRNLLAAAPLGCALAGAGLAAVAARRPGLGRARSPPAACSGSSRSSASTSTRPAGATTGEAPSGHSGTRPVCASSSPRRRREPSR